MLHWRLLGCRQPLELKRHNNAVILENVVAMLFSVCSGRKVIPLAFNHASSMRLLHAVKKGQVHTEMHQCCSEKLKVWINLKKKLFITMSKRAELNQHSLGFMATGISTHFSGSRSVKVPQNRSSGVLAWSGPHEKTTYPFLFSGSVGGHAMFAKCLVKL